MQYTLVLINRIQRLATLYMIFVGSALKKSLSHKIVQYKTPYTDKLQQERFILMHLYWRKLLYTYKYMKKPADLLKVEKH